MLHFNPLVGGFNATWGAQNVYSTDYAWPDNIANVAARIAAPTVGQGLGGIGIYRTTTGQPQALPFNGAYTFDTYITTYSYANGSYSLALQVSVSLSETLNLADAATYSMVMQIALPETLNLADTSAELRITSMTLAESLTLNDVVTLNTVFGILLPESLFMRDLLADTGGSSGALVAYVVNVNTSAVAKYTNYQFNSFAKLNGKYLAADATGIYELTGTDDNGTGIDASVVLPTTDFGTDKVAADVLKSLPVVYLGVNTVGDIMLKVTANGLDNFYTLTGTTTTSLHTGRMLLGKGVKARYWDFEMTNVDGADFTLESITFHPVALTRRIVRG